MSRVVILGAGGHAAVVADAISAEGRFEVAGFLVASGAVGSTLLDWPVLGSDGLLDPASFDAFVVGFAGLGTGARRAERFEFARGLGLEAATVVHPAATVSRFASMGDGAVVLARVIVNARALVGVNAILNTGAIVEHDCVVGDHSHIGPAVVLTGGVLVGARCTVGAGAVVLPGCAIGDDAVVGAGAVVTRDVGAGVKVVGNPARVLV